MLITYDTVQGLKHMDARAIMVVLENCFCSGELGITNCHDHQELDLVVVLDNGGGVLMQST